MKTLNLKSQNAAGGDISADAARRWRHLQQQSRRHGRRWLPKFEKLRGGKPLEGEKKKKNAISAPSAAPSARPGEGRGAEFKVASISQGCLKWSNPPEFLSPPPEALICTPEFQLTPGALARPNGLSLCIIHSATLVTIFVVKLIRFQSPCSGRCQWFEMKIISR